MVTANGEVSSIRGSVTGRTADSLLAINNNGFPRPSAIQGKTSAIHDVYSQVMIVRLIVIMSLRFPIPFP